MTVRAIIVRELGPPERHRIEPVQVLPPGLGEARVAIAAAGMNFPDLLMLEGRYQLRPELPFVPGMEAAGTILETGPGESRFRTGARVIVRMRHGAFAEQVTLRQEQLLPLPDLLSFEEGATFTVAALTAIHALKDRARLTAGETLLVLGAAGGVGLAAVEFGARSGALVVAACAGAAKAALARARGAHHVVDYDREDLRERVLDLTDGRGADVIYDPVGGKGFDAAMRCIAWGGRLLLIGFASGTIPRLRTNLALLKGCSVIGVRAGENARRDPALGRENIQRAFAIAAEGGLRPNISHRVPFDDFPEAYRILAERRAFGRVALMMQDHA